MSPALKQPQFRRFWQTAPHRRQRGRFRLSATVAKSESNSQAATGQNGVINVLIKQSLSRSCQLKHMAGDNRGHKPYDATCSLAMRVFTVWNRL